MEEYAGGRGVDALSQFVQSKLSTANNEAVRSIKKKGEGGERKKERKKDKIRRSVGNSMKGGGDRFAITIKCARFIPLPIFFNSSVFAFVRLFCPFFCS